MSFRPPIGVRLKSSVLTRRDLQHSGSGLAVNWPMCRDRHPGISQFWSYLTTRFTKLGGNVGWQGFQEVARGWGGNEGIRIGQGIRFQPFSAYFEPFRIGSGPFSYLLGVPYYFPYHSYHIPIPPVWLCCAVYLFLCPCVVWGLGLAGHADLLLFRAVQMNRIQHWTDRLYYSS